MARVDSYIVSVTGGGRFVGDRRLVRIESVGRSAATASLVGEAGGPTAGTALTTQSRWLVERRPRRIARPPDGAAAEGAAGAVLVPRPEQSNGD